MAADFIIDPSQSPAGNRYQSFAAYVTANGSNLVTAARGRYTEFQIATDLTEQVDFATWTTDATNGILVTFATQATTWRIPGTGGYAYACDTGGKYFQMEGGTLRGGTNTGIGQCLIARSNCLIRRMKIWGVGAGVYLIGAARLEFCLAYSCVAGFELTGYSNPFLYNCTAILNTNGFHRNGTPGSTNATIWNCASFGNSNNNWNGWSSATQHVTSARNNAGASGNTVPQTVSSTTITVSSSDFVDYTNPGTGGFHITSTSALRHTHASFPSGDNTITSGTHTDIDGETMPVYSTDADRWDCGCDFYVLVVVGERYYIATDVPTAALSTVVYRDSDDAAFTLDDLVEEDTLEIREGAEVHFSGLSYLKGINLEILNGEFWLENASTTLGHTFWGLFNGNLLVGARGRFFARGELIELADLSDGTYSSDRDVDNGEWAAMWDSDSQDSNGDYGSPAVLFVGASAGSAVPYFNESSGSTIGDLANDATHGRTFRFDPATGDITWPNVVPSTSEKVYCWNLMIHSSNGQGTPAQSYGFDTLAKGQVDIEGLYFTGDPRFVDASVCRLAGLGIVLPFTLDHCSNVEIEVYQGLDQANEQLGSNFIKNLSGQASLGSFYGLMNGSGLRLQSLRSCVFDTLFMEGFGSQTSGGYRITIEGTDDCDFGDVTVIDGGVSFESGISINPVIQSLNHSNDQSGSNGNNAQHVINGAATGTRGLRVNAINLLANGQPTALALANLVNAGNARIKAVAYPAIVRNCLFVESCFDVLMSDVSISRCTRQVLETPVPPAGRSSNIRVQGVRNSASPSSPSTFVEYSIEGVDIRNSAFENSARYSGWTNPVQDANFLEMNLGNGGEGVLVLNFSQNTKGQFSYTGLAGSNNADAAVLPADGDTVEVEWPYEIEVGSASPYFQNTAPTVVGTETGNLDIEYAVNVDGAGWGSWQALTGANLSAESLGTRFRIRFRITATADDETTAIEQIVLETNIDDAVNYPVDSFTLTLTGLQEDTEVRIFDSTTGAALAGSEDVGPSGEFSYTYDYYGDTQVDIHIISLGYVIQRFAGFTLGAADKTQLIVQVPDRTYANP